MNFLICNDDGIESKGLISIAEKLAKNNNVLIVAPDGNRSASSHSLSISNSIKVTEKKHVKGCKSYAISGTPVDCVKFATLALSDFKTDVVVAGINKGHNLGSDILYSGTLSIAIEAAFFGYISFAFSAYSLGESNFDLYSSYSVNIINQLLPISKPGDIWNVNFPDNDIDKINGIKFTPLGKQLYTDRYVEIAKNEYVLKGEIINHNDNPIDCDIEWIKKGYITITPILLNKTSYEKIEEVKKLCIKL